MNFVKGDTEFSQGNPDHVGEVLDAWEQVQQHPVMGIGLGHSFATLRIQDWKEESVMVHNAPLHVWLKYGLLGLVCYVWFHLAMFRWLYRRMRVAPKDPQTQVAQLGREKFSSLGMTRKEASIVGAALTYLVALFVVSLGFTPWPYSSLQSTTLIAFLLAMAMAGTTPCIYPASR